MESHQTPGQTPEPQNTNTPAEKFKNFFKNKNGKYSPIKVLGVPVLLLIILYIIIWVFGVVFSNNSHFGMQNAEVSSLGGPSLSPRGLSFNTASKQVAYDTASPESASDSGASESSYETTRYSVRYETPSAEQTCDKIQQIEKRFGATFKDARRSDDGCHYTFMVKNDRAKNTLVYLKQFGPENITKHTEREEKLATRLEGKVDILKTKLSSVTQTLKSAKSSYDNIIALSKNNANIEGLNKAVQNKIDTIDRLTTKKINTTQKIKQTLRRTQNLDERFTHTYFTVDVIEETYFNWDRISDDWQQATQNAIYDISEIFQGLTLGLITFIFTVIKILLYLLIICFFLLFLAKFGYRTIKNIWRE